MRKCPNCKKAVPVGARRCVYCRASVDDNASGLSGASKAAPETWEEEENNSTSFGKPGSKQFSSAMNSDFGGSGPQHTLLGLGPVSLEGARSRVKEDPNDGFGQTTMMGMPGVTHERSPGLGSQKISIASPKLEEKAAPEPIAKAEPAPTQDAGPVDDPLFGLLGVIAPKPSSLIDEEFTNLSSEVFGDDFDFKLDDDDDGWDFDFEPEPKKEAPKAPEPSRQQAPAPQIDAVVTVSSAAQKAAPSQSASTTPKNDSPEAVAPKPQKTEAPAAQAPKKIPTEPKEPVRAEQKQTQSEHKSTSPTKLREDRATISKVSPVEVLLIVLTALVSIVWIVVPSQEHGAVWDHFAGEPHNLALLGLSIFSCVACLSTLKAKNAVGISLLVLAALAMVVGIVIAPIGQWQPHRAILGGAAVLAVICAIIQLFKKS